MTIRNRLPEALLAILAVTAAATFFYPIRGTPLPAPKVRAAASPGEPVLDAANDAIKASPAELGALFFAQRAPAVRAQKKPVPEKVPWLRFVAYVVGPEGETTYFFKNEQNGRVLMLSSHRPQSGWKMSSIQAGAYVLEKDGHAYLVTERRE